MGVAGGLGGQQRPVQGGFPRGQLRDRLVAVVVGGRQADVVARGQLGHAGVIEQPAQYQHGLLVSAQRAGVLAGTSADPLGVQQTGQEQHAVLGHVEHSGVCDTHGGAEPHCR
jgi:hypothetical protein